MYICHKNCYGCVLLSPSLSGINHQFPYFTDGWEDRWVDSTHKGGEQGKFKRSAGKFYGDADKDQGNWRFLQLQGVACPIKFFFVGTKTNFQFYNGFLLKTLYSVADNVLTIYYLRGIIYKE